MANPQSPLDRFLSRLIKSDPPRAKSLCVSLLGDALAPHGGAIWLGDLIELLAPLGINERLLRTSVFRLVAQNWLQSERHGRRSLYLISELGQRHTAHASQRIYEGAPQDWNGNGRWWPCPGSATDWPSAPSCAGNWCGKASA